MFDGFQQGTETYLTMHIKNNQITAWRFKPKNIIDILICVFDRNSLIKQR